MLQNFWVGMDVQKLLSSMPQGCDTARTMLLRHMDQLKALEQANQAAFDAFHQLFNCQNDILHSTLSEVVQLTQSNQLTPDTMAKQAELAVQLTEKTLENLRQLSETIVQSSQEASQTISDSFRQSLADLHPTDQV